MKILFATLITLLISCNNDQHVEENFDENLINVSPIYSGKIPTLNDTYQIQTKYSYNLPNREVLNVYIEIDSNNRINNGEFEKKNFSNY